MGFNIFTFIIGIAVFTPIVGDGTETYPVYYAMIVMIGFLFLGIELIIPMKVEMKRKNAELQKSVHRSRMSSVFIEEKQKHLLKQDESQDRSQEKY